MKIQFCGAAKTVTGSSYLVDTGKSKFLVDCGAFQGSYEMEMKNKEPFPYDPSQLDVIFLTHAHFDHCGRIPMLVKQGFRGKIICTQPTRDLTKVVLMDSAKLQEEEFKRWESRVEDSTIENREPLYTVGDVEEAMSFFEVYPYGNSVNLKNGIEFRMRDSGHILGSSMIEVWVDTEAERTRKFVFSGDLGQPGARIIKDPDMIRETDYLIIESTYGNRLHKNKDETVTEMLEILKHAQASQSNVLIPSFAIERTQEILYEINLFIESHQLNGLEVYLDSPMANKATDIFRQYPNFYDEDARRLLEKGDDPFDFPGLFRIVEAEDSKRLITKKGVVIIAGSGMCTGGRIVHHLKNNLENPNTHVVFVGYQVEGTLGRRLVDGEKIVKIHGVELDVKAQIHTLGGFSAHADERDLKYWVRGFGKTPKKVFVTHGDAEISEDFAEALRQELGLDAYVPDLNEEIDLK